MQQRLIISVLMFCTIVFIIRIYLFQSHHSTASILATDVSPRGVEDRLTSVAKTADVENCDWRNNNLRQGKFFYIGLHCSHCDQWQLECNLAATSVAISIVNWWSLRGLNVVIDHNCFCIISLVSIVRLLLKSIKAGVLSWQEKYPKRS